MLADSVWLCLRWWRKMRRIVLQAQAMVEIVKQLGWTYVSTLAAQGEYGEKVRTAGGRKCSESNQTIFREFPHSFSWQKSPEFVSPCPWRSIEMLMTRSSMMLWQLSLLQRKLGYDPKFNAKRIRVWLFLRLSYCSWMRIKQGGYKILIING